MWRETGLPMMHTFLKLDGGLMDQSGLVNPHSLWEANVKARFAANAPLPRVEVFQEGVAGYLKATNNVKVRMQFRPKRVPKFIKNGKLLTEEELLVRAAEAEKRQKELSRKMTAAQWAAENKVLDRMTQRLNYLRNPRFRDDRLPGGLGARKGQKGRKALSSADLGFIVEPSVVEFRDYRVGGIYEMEIDLRNISTFSRRIRLLPPTTQYFSIGKAKFPAGHGLIAPGMFCQCNIRFTPDSLADYDDFFLVETDLNTFKVPLTARRTPPTLTVPQTLDCSFCLVGNTSTTQIECKNLGGGGQFKVIAEADWPDNIPPSRGEISLPPFTFSPGEFALGRGEETQFSLTFSPRAAGEYVQQFRMVCDNCQVKTFTILGVGAEVDVDVVNDDGEVLDSATPSWFDQVVPGSSFSRSFKILNRTPVPLPFAWAHLCVPEKVPSEAAAPGAADAGADAVAPVPAAEEPRFVVEPSSGTLAAKDHMDFTVTFHPDAIASYSRFLQLKVDKSVAGSIKGADHEIVKIKVEGAGKQCDVSLAPPMIDFTGTMLLGKKYFREVTLKNSARAQTTFRFEGLGDGVQIEPQEGVLHPLEELELDVSVVAESLGDIERQIVCRVEHGHSLPLKVTAKVVGATVEFRQPNVDFGLVQVDTAAEAELAIANLSDIPAVWELKEKGAAGHLTCSRARGELGPLESTVVTLACRPREELALRTVVSCFVDGGETKHIAVRADVIAPKTCLDRPVIDAGVSYVNVPIEFVVTQKNLTMLPAQYQWDESTLNTEACSLTISPMEGTIKPGGEEEFFVTAIAHKVGGLEILQSCDVVGMAEPLGFLVKSEVKGLVVTYEIVQSDGSRTKFAMDEPTELLFGSDCQIRERKALKLVVRNESAICVPISVELERFAAPVPKPPGEGNLGRLAKGTPNTNTLPGTAGTGVSSFSRLSARTSATGASAGSSRGRWRKAPLLTDATEKLHPFSSALGRSMMDERRSAGLDATMLSEGKGIALQTAPGAGILDPWGTWECEIMCYSNMCGDYQDVLECEVGSLPKKRIPVRVGVVGSPLVMQKERNPPKKFPGLGDFKTGLDLVWGQSPISAKVSTHRYYVKNTAPFDMAVAWRVHGEPAEGQAEVVRVDLHPTRDGVQLFVHPHAPPGTCPFVLEPEEMVVPAGAVGEVSVAFASDDPRAHRAYISGIQRVHRERDDDVELRLWGLEQGAERLEAVLCGEFHQYAAQPPVPMLPLTVGLVAESVLPRLDTDGKERLLFHCHSCDPPEHYSYRQTIVLSNRYTTPLAFIVKTKAPFFISGLEPSIEQADAPGEDDDLDRMAFYLPARENLDVAIRFQPAPARGALEDQQLDGRLQIFFSSDPGASYQQILEGATAHMTQEIPLVAEYVFPGLVLSHEELDFGTVHPNAPKVLELTLTNPTTADVDWKIKEGERAGEEEPEVFTVHPTAGFIAGRGLGQPQKQKIQVTCAPRGGMLCEKRLLFSTRKGKDNAVALRGEGAWGEVLESELALTLY